MKDKVLFYFISLINLLSYVWIVFDKDSYAYDFSSNVSIKVPKVAYLI